MADSTGTTGLPRIEIVLPQKDGLRVGDVIAPELRGTNLPAGARLKAGGGLEPGYAISESGQIAILKPGPLQLPSLDVVDAEGNLVAHSDPIELNAQSVIQQQQGEKPPEPEPAAGPQSLGIPVGLQIGVGVVFLIVMTLIVYGLIRLLGRFLRKSKPAMSLPPEAPDVWALKRLQKLEADRWYEKGQSKKHFFEISETLKAYFGDRYGIDARESTTSELMDRLADLEKRSALTSEQFRGIRDCFAVLDLVKFTDYQPSGEESRAQLEEARKIVVRTRAPVAALTPSLETAPAKARAPEETRA